MASSDPPYPREWETDALLSDGSAVRIRPLHPRDRELMVDFHRRQSPQSIYFRYFSPHPRLSDSELDHVMHIDYRTRMAFVAIVADRLVGVARYEGWSPDGDVDPVDALHAGTLNAEVSFFVDDGFQGRGLGTLLLEYLAAAARTQGLRGFVAHVLPENYGMLRVFRRAGFDVSTSFEDGIINVALGIDVTPEASAAIDAREREAQARSVARILEPGSVAVVGAGRHPESVGHRLTRSLVAGRFSGRVQVVSNHAGTIADLPAVASIADLEAPVDIAILCVPANEVLDSARACVDLGVAGLVVISAGFSDVGPAGAEQQDRLVELVRRHGLRLIGPNTFGVANTDPSISLRALFLPVPVPPGEVGLLSQSGPLGAALLSVFERSGTGISTFTALGNRADVSVNDLLQYWAADPRTKAIALYLESFGNFQKFTRIARSVSSTKPIVAVAPVDADRAELVRQSGVVLVPEVGELAVQARLAVTQAVPQGRRVVVVSNASSVAVLCVAACRQAGLEVVLPTPTPPSADGASSWVRVRDAERLSLADAEARPDYERAVVAAAVSSEVDAVMVALVPAPGLDTTELARLLDRIDDAIDKPMVAVGLTGVSSSDVSRLPLFDFPEQAARALGRWADYGVWRRRDRGEPLPRPNAEVLARLIGRLSTVGGENSPARRELDRAEVEEVLATSAIDAAPTRVVSDAGAAVTASIELGFPVVLKAGDISHRLAGEAGGVALDLGSAEQVSDAFGRMRERIPGFLPALVQTMVPTGRHLVIEVRQDSDGGARLALAVRGASTGGAVPLRRLLVLPATTAEVASLVDAVSGAEGFSVEGRHALVRLVGNVAAAVGSEPGLVRLDLNPVLISGRRAVVVDASIEIERFERDPLAEVRHL